MYGIVLQNSERSKRTFLSNQQEWQSDENTNGKPNWFLGDPTHASLKTWRKCVTASKVKILSSVKQSHSRMYWEAVGLDSTNLTTNQTLTFVPFLTYSFPYTLQGRGVSPPYPPALLFGGM